MPISIKQLDECRDLLLNLAPELHSHPLYVEDAESFRDLPCNRGGWLGWAATGTMMDRNVADRLGARYVGPGTLIVLDIEAIKADAQPGAFERCLVNTAIHEAAHVLPVREVYEPADMELVRDWQAARLARDLTNPVVDPANPNNPHDIAFIRRCTHLLYRAIVRGTDVPADGLFGPQIWMSRPEFYLTTLLHECSASVGDTFAVIESRDPSASFVALWEADVRFYNTNFSSKGF